MIQYWLITSGVSRAFELLPRNERLVYIPRSTTLVCHSLIKIKSGFSKNLIGAKYTQPWINVALSVYSLFQYLYNVTNYNRCTTIDLNAHYVKSCQMEPWSRLQPIEVKFRQLLQYFVDVRDINIGS